MWNASSTTSSRGSGRSFAVRFARWCEIGMGRQCTRLVSASARCVVILLCLQPVVVRAQQPGPAQATGDDTLTLKARLVDIDVIVKDKRGRFIPDLEAKDFEIVENG